MTTEEKRQHHAHRLGTLVEQFGPSTRVKVHANNMLAGPCPGCIALAAKPSHLARSVPLMPLPECPHPDQCTGRYQFVLELD